MAELSDEYQGVLSFISENLHLIQIAVGTFTEITTRARQYTGIGVERCADAPEINCRYYIKVNCFRDCLSFPTRCAFVWCFPSFYLMYIKISCHSVCNRSSSKTALPLFMKFFLYVTPKNNVCRVFQQLAHNCMRIKSQVRLLSINISQKSLL